MTRLFLTLLLTASTPLGAAILASSQFDSGPQGWAALTADDAQANLPASTIVPLTFNATGGNPGGYITAADTNNLTTYFAAPAAFRGNLLAALNGTISFDMRYTGTVNFDFYDVVIKGGGLVLRFDAPLPPIGPNGWTTLQYAIGPGAGWTTSAGGAATLADFQTALANVTDFWILGEYTTGIVETADLDNVTLSSIPEPSGLAALGLAALWVARKLKGRG